MALNPIAYTEKVVRSFLRYQLTTYPFADERLLRQMRSLLSLDETRRSPLMKGPYLSLSRPFRQGAAVAELVRAGIFHPHMRERIPEAITHVYGHQEEAIRAIHARRTTLVSTGTGSGKSECFLYPIVSRCLELRDAKAPSGICAVVVYPMNALAEDQLQRLRGLLAGTRIPFGMYVGKTPENEAEVTGLRLAPGASRADYEKALERVRKEHRSEAVLPPEEVASREMMRTPGRQPRILLTNVKQLELLLTRQRDVELFAGARLDFLVFDEAHTFTGAQGAESACLIRRLRNFCGRSAEDTVCVATSATIADPRNPGAAREFAARFFGVEPGGVATVGEAYESLVWKTSRRLPAAPKRAPAELLQAAVKVVEEPDGVGVEIRKVYRDLAGADLAKGAWQEALHEALSANELVFQMAEQLAAPLALADLTEGTSKRVGRPVDEAEALAWLTLGAAARKDGRPLLRPVVHGFIRGISGAVVSFPGGAKEPKLWLAAEDEVDAAKDGTQAAHFPVTTCTNCGQHYFVAFLEDFQFSGRKPEGGRAAGGGSVWPPLEETQGGRRVVLLDQLVGESDDDDLDTHDRTSALHFCRHCGAAHPVAGERCLHCGQGGPLVALYAVRQSEENPGYLTSCLSCSYNGSARGSRYREPARPVRATNVADVHVLAQDMIQHAERPRLLIFCDNRQDAAFQAGWMKDHARRFRLRSMMAEGLRGGAKSIGDLAMYLDDRLDQDESLSRALVPEVWLVARREGEGGRHQEERRKFLRIQVLREVTLSARQSIGLEPWGRMRVEYQGLDIALPWIQTKAHALGVPAEDLREGVASVLDYLRRKRVLHDPERKIYTKYWAFDAPEILNGYLPNTGAPCGTKLRREASEKNEYVTQWTSEHGEPTIRQIVKKWGVESKDRVAFLEELFALLKDVGLLTPVRLLGQRGNPLPGVSGLYQADADRLRLQENHGIWRCDSCRRRTSRRTPKLKCPAWRCDGSLVFLPEDPDNYDLQVLDQRYTMLRPEEHTAMVPHEERERLENLFKGESDVINAFVCTPTLELGVDIGQLDSVLMRNVPPLPANYWQRAGRAGRRHRMAVNLTYCRPVSHDRAYFADPLKLLAGRVDPPAFNLRNELMVAKHVHATVLTRLQQHARDPRRAEPERAAISWTLDNQLPRQVSSFLFDESGSVRVTAFDFSPLRELIQANLDDLCGVVERTFGSGWPAADAEVVQPAVLRAHLEGFVGQLKEVVQRLARRLRWALNHLERLARVRAEKGTLDSEEESLFRRCDGVVKRFKGVARRTRRDAEGYDDSNTFGVLAAEGFLPGYGLEVGSVLGTAEIPSWHSGAREFALPRAPSVALREYVPGNLIYANGNRFVARRFHRDVDEQRIDLPAFEVSTERQAIRQVEVGESASTLGSTVLKAIAVCDVDLAHQSHISDDEELRFQIGVATYGREQEQHNGGRAYRWGEQPLHHRRGVRLQLVNVGVSSLLRDSQRADRFGYPVCTICGQSVSPLSSDAQRRDFLSKHQERCGRRAESVGFYANTVADALSLPGCRDQGTAHSVLEALRFAAAQVLDMHLEDLQLLVIGHVDRDEVDALLWDPMPGGSGLLDQLCERFGEIHAAARALLDSCPGACDTSCIDCLQTFRNGFYHKHLDRKRALECLDAWGPTLALDHAIPPMQPASETTASVQPVNEAERKLRGLLRSAGFEEGTRGEQILLDPAIGSTTPDVIYRRPDHGPDEGICIYLDGMSSHLHGNPRTREKDQTIRSWLRNQGWEVIEITVHDLDDRNAMTRHFRKLAGYLEDKALRESLSKDGSWFDAQEAPAASKPVPFRLVQPAPEDRYRTCVPLRTLKAAAGEFGTPHHDDDADTQWVEPTSRHRLAPGMFVAQVVGHSMEPRIPDGAYCLFAPAPGTRQGKIVLVSLRDQTDPESGERFTLKCYRSEKATASDGTWRHLEITLEPLNPEFKTIRLEADSEGAVKVVAEFVEVLGE